jgi:hypothetical protein
MVTGAPPARVNWGSVGQPRSLDAGPSFPAEDDARGRAGAFAVPIVSVPDRRKGRDPGLRHGR